MLSNDSSHPPNIQFFLIQNLITSLNIHALFCFYFHVDFHFLTLLNDEGGGKVWWCGEEIRPERGKSLLVLLCCGGSLNDGREEGVVVCLL